MKLPRANYFQGILQLRDINEEILSFVNNQIKKRGDVAVTKIQKHSNGIDLYITSQKFIQMMGKKLKDSFGGELKTSAKLHTKKKGKELHRVNVMFKLSKYRRGDIVTVRGDKVQLLRTGNRIFARDIKTGKKVIIRNRDLPQD